MTDERLEELQKLKKKIDTLEHFITHHSDLAISDTIHPVNIVVVLNQNGHDYTSLPLDPKLAKIVMDNLNDQLAELRTAYKNA